MSSILKKYFFLLFTSVLFKGVCFSQVGVPVPQYGFLPGVKLPFYPTVDKYDLNKKLFNLVFTDDRKSFSKVFCSETPLTHNSEFEGDYGVTIVEKYFDTLIAGSNGVINASGKTINVSLQVLCPRLVGFGYITVHGMCQIKIEYEGFKRTYCVDLKDGDPNSPLGKEDSATRKTAMRLMMSAGIREVVEKIISDFSKNL